MKAIWEFLKREEKMSLGSKAYKKVFSTSGFSDEELLAREGLQNCKDALTSVNKSKSIPATVRITKKIIGGDDKKNLIKSLKLDQQIDKASLLIDPSRNGIGFEEFINSKKPITTVTFADTNTVGLGGVWNGDDVGDHFSRLVLRLGDTEKPEGGGSFGFGKTVFAKLSKLNLVIFYSHFPETSETAGVNTRLMAVWLLKESDKLKGFGFFGKAKSDDQYSTMPFENDEAHEIAAACGIDLRNGPAHYGTSISMIDCEINMYLLKDAIEKYWWPSIHDHKLAVRLFDESKRIIVDPIENEFVKPYIEMYRDFTQGDGNLSDNAQKFVPNNLNGYQLGTLCYKQIDQLSVERIRKQQTSLGLDSDDEKATIGGVARIREAGMVVSYDTTRINPARPVAAFFLAHKGIDGIIRGSEPPEHDRWDDMAHERISEEAIRHDVDPIVAIKIVKAINQRISSRLLEALQDEQPPPTPENYRLREAETIMSRFLKKNLGDIKPPTTIRPFSLSVKTESILKDKNRIDISRISLALNDEYDAEQLECVVVVECGLLGDPRGTVKSRLKCTLHNDTTDDFIDMGDKPEAQVLLIKGQTLKLCASAEADHKDVTKFKVLVLNKKPTNK